MADSFLAQSTRNESQNKAREILDGLFPHRIHPSTIRIIDSKPSAKGGQGTIVVGTRIAPEEVPTWDPEQFPKEFFEKKLAIKKLEWDPEDAEASAKFFISFVNELSIMANISHPNIVEFVGFVEDIEKGDAWIVLPWEPNGNVREFLASGEWDIPERLSLIHDVAQGVEYLHTRQPPICHGDLKSMNILVNSSYSAVITDFGSARAKRNVDSKVEDTGSKPPRRVTIEDLFRIILPPELPFEDFIQIVQKFSGPKIEFNQPALELTLTGPGYTLRWTAPEVLSSEVQDLPSDMWALGWICWEIFTGKIPFEDLRDMGPIISKVVHGKLPAIREEADLSHILKLCSLMTDCWMLNPVERIDASTFWRKVRFLPSVTPSADRSGGAKVRSAPLLCKLGTMYELQDNYAEAESHYQSAVEIATLTKDDRAKAEALAGLGEIYRKQSKYREAEKALMAAHEIHVRIGDELGAAHVLVSLGHVYRVQSRYRVAEKVFMKAHQINSRIGHDNGAANALVGLGYVYRVQSRYGEAEKAFVEAYEINSRIGHDNGAANALEGLGNIYRIQSRYQEAEKALMKVHQICSRTGDDMCAADALYTLGDIYRCQSRHREAEKALMESQEIQSRIGNELGVANTLYGLGNMYRGQLKNREAEKAFMEAHEIYSRIANDLGAAHVLNGLGEIYSAQLRYREAEKTLMEAHEIHSRVGSDLGAANALCILGRTYSQESKNLEAEEAFIKVLEIYSRVGHDLGVANALLGLGNTYCDQSRNAEAENALNDARTIYSRVGSTFGTGNASHGLAVLYRKQNRYDAAEASYRQAVASFDAAGAGDHKARTLFALAVIYHAQYRYSDAEEAANEALAIFISMANEQGQAGASQLLATIKFDSQSRHNNEKEALVRAEPPFAQIGRDLHQIGDVHRAQRAYDKAEECYRIARTIFSRMDDIRGEATEVFTLGVLYGCQHRRDEAEKCFAEARVAYARIVDKEGEAKALNGLVGVYALQRKFAAARAACVEARRIYTQMGRPMSAICAAIWELLQAWEQSI